MDWSGSGLGQLDLICEHGNEHIGPKRGKGRACFDYMRK
jgi:hypothetical protein